MARSGRDYNLDDQREPVRPGASHSQLPAPGGPREPEAARAASARQPYREPDRDRRYPLRDSELGTLLEVATFRAVTLDDLTLYRYGGDGTRARTDLDDLDRQGLIRRRTAYPERTVYLTLTRQGHRIVEHHRPPGLHRRQVLYHGFVKPREAKHDATLYRLYHHQAERIQAQGGKIQRVVLDFELKKVLNRELSKLGSLPESTRAQQRNELALQHGLKVVSGRIPVPDLQIEYETADREQARVNLELATAHYHRDGLAAKARAGFAMYALPEDAAPLHRALQDSGLMEEILSL